MYVPIIIALEITPNFVTQREGVLTSSCTVGGRIEVCEALTRKCLVDG